MDNLPVLPFTLTQVSNWQFHYSFRPLQRIRTCNQASSQNSFAAPLIQ